MKNHRNQLKHNQIHKGYPSFAENVVFRNANFENNNIVFRILKMHAFADKGYPLWIPMIFNEFHYVLIEKRNIWLRNHLNFNGI